MRKWIVFSLSALHCTVVFAQTPLDVPEFEQPTLFFYSAQDAVAGTGGAVAPSNPDSTQLETNSVSTAPKETESKSFSETDDGSKSKSEDAAKPADSAKSDDAANPKAPEEPKPYIIGSASDLTAKVNNGGLQFETANKDFRFHVGSLIQQDYAFFSQDEALEAPPSGGVGPGGGIGELEDSVYFRRARLRFDGIAYDTLEWDFDCELLASSDVVFDDLWVGLTNLPILGNVRAGHVKIPMGIESITSNRVFTFMERASMFDAFLPEYGSGVLAFDSYQDATLTWAACLHRLDPTGNGSDAGDGQWNGTFRLSSLLYNSSDDRHYLHVGSAYSIRDDRNGSVRFRGRPEFRDTTTIASLNNRFVDTGDIAADDNDLWQAEIAWVAGAFSAQSEYVSATVNSDVLGDQQFHGGYVMTSYFLTGESRAYDKRLGRFARLKPTENFFLTRRNSGEPRSVGAFGRGAWELAARYSWVDLTSAGVLGGEQEAYTMGVNWYWNYNFRMQWNYIHTLRNASNPASISGDTDAFGMRFSFDI